MFCWNATAKRQWLIGMRTLVKSGRRIEGGGKILSLRADASYSFRLCSSGFSSISSPNFFVS